MDDGGWVPIHRARVTKFLEEVPKRNRPGVPLLVYDFLVRARWTPGYVVTETCRVWLERGQLVIGRRSTSEKLGLTEKRFRTAVNWLESVGFLALEAAHTYTVATIREYDTYCPPKKETVPPNGQDQSRTGPAPGQDLATKEHGVQGGTRLYTAPPAHARAHPSPLNTPGEDPVSPVQGEEEPPFFGDCICVECNPTSRCPHLAVDESGLCAKCQERCRSNHAVRRTG